MELRDITFIFTLFCCMIFSSQYKNETAQEKKIYGAFIGLLVIFLISGEHMFHPIFITLINSIIILQGDKRVMHIQCFVFSWAYLMLLHLNLINVPWQTIAIHMIITLRLVGLSFEINASYLSKNRKRINFEECMVNETILKHISVTEELPYDPDIEDICLYTFNFVGLHRGPYYKWKTYNDYMNLPFMDVEDITVKTLDRMKNVPVCFVVFFWLKLFYPLKHYILDINENNLGTYWYWYNIPQFIILLLHRNMIGAICETMCIDAGLGVYPDKCKNKPGAGPTQNLELLQELKELPELVYKETYDFNTIKDTDEMSVTMGPTMRECLKAYNMTIQYWFWSCIYRRLPFDDKYTKTVISMVCWLVWSGLNMGNIIAVITILLYIFIEDIFIASLHQTFGVYDNALYIGTCVFSRLTCFIYLTPSLFYTDTLQILNFYNSTYWSYHIFLISILLLGALYNHIMKSNNRVRCYTNINLI